jgi:hypothetical protein
MSGMSSSAKEGEKGRSILRANMAMMREAIFLKVRFVSCKPCILICLAGGPAIAFLYQMIKKEYE